MSPLSEGYNLPALLAELRDNAEAPLTKAKALNPRLYHLPEIYELERRRIFARSWACAGFARDIPETGDYVTFSLLDQPIYVIRLSNGEIQAFSNVCRHRMSPLLSGAGNVKRIVCPYHAWTYDGAGTLIGAPHMRQTEGFANEDHCLPKIRTEVWRGFIYVTLDEEQAPIADQLEGLSQILSRYGMENYIPVVNQDLVWSANWKLIVENFMEGYHGPIAHRRTVGAGVDLNDMAFPEARFDAFTYSTWMKPEGSTYGCAHADNERLEGVWRRTGVTASIFPAHMFSCSPDYLWHLSVRPDGTDRSKVRVGIAIAPEDYESIEDVDAYVSSLVEFFDRVNDEDKGLVESLSTSMRAPLARPGPLSWLERELHDFANYLAKQLL